MDAAGVEEFKKSPISEWPFDAGEIVKNGYGIIKVSLQASMLNKYS